MTSLSALYGLWPGHMSLYPEHLTPTFTLASDCRSRRCDIISNHCCVLRFRISSAFVCSVPQRRSHTQRRNVHIKAAAISPDIAPIRYPDPLTPPRAMPATLRQIPATMQPGAGISCRQRSPRRCPSRSRSSPDRPLCRHLYTGPLPITYSVPMLPSGIIFRFRVSYTQPCGCGFMHRRNQSFLDRYRRHCSLWFQHLQYIASGFFQHSACISCSTPFPPIPVIKRLPNCSPFLLVFCPGRRDDLNVSEQSMLNACFAAASPYRRPED